MKVMLKNYQVRDLFAAIKAMDGRPEVVKDADGKFVGILNKPYEFDDAKAVYAMAKTRELLRPSVAAVESAQQSLIASISKDADKTETATVDAKLNVMWNEEVEVEVHNLAIVALKVHTNKIPPSILCDLLPMLDGDL